MEMDFETQALWKYVNVTFNSSNQAVVHTGHMVVKLVEALHYKPEGHGFDSRWCQWNFSLT
jgi:hypothetical protein